MSDCERKKKTAKAKNFQLCSDIFASPFKNYLTQDLWVFIVTFPSSRGWRIRKKKKKKKKEEEENGPPYKKQWISFEDPKIIIKKKYGTCIVAAMWSE